MVKYSPTTLNRTFAALADPTRRRILAHLARGDRRVTDLARPHAMSLPAVSKHLRVLEKAGLLRRRRYGRVHEMQLNAQPLKKAAQWVEEYRKFWEGSLCFASALLVVAGATSGGGMTALVAKSFMKEKKQQRKSKEPKYEDHSDGTRSRVAS
jgi:DNA-binding transcriptional ArsR family regulator